MIRNSCRHFTGISAKKCEAGISYQRPLQRVCIGEPGECEKFSPYTKEEIEASEAATKRSIDLMQRGLSSCCEAPIDESHVIREGRHKGHGARYCSKCGCCCFMV